MAGVEDALTVNVTDVCGELLAPEAVMVIVAV